MANKKEKKQKIEDEIQHLLKEMEKIPTDSEEYVSMSNSLKTLCEARSFKTKSDVSSETWLQIGTYILGTLLVLHHEEVNVISSKAFGNIPKLFK
jgi:hypothetical protein